MAIASRIIHPDWPWLTPAAVRFLERWLGPSHVVFEWGAGRSTIWLAQRVKKVISVEHDCAWYGKIRNEAARLGLGNVDLHLVRDWREPSYQRRYVNTINKAPYDFDLVFVDGLHRDHCALAALRKVKPGGLLLIDNINWYLPCASNAPASRRKSQAPASREWAEVEREVRPWMKHWTTNGVFDTAIWVRPATSAGATVFLEPAALVSNKEQA